MDPDLSEKNQSATIEVEVSPSPLDVVVKLEPVDIEIESGPQFEEVNVKTECTDYTEGNEGIKVEPQEWCVPQQFCDVTIKEELPESYEAQVEQQINEDGAPAIVTANVNREVTTKKRKAANKHKVIKRIVVKASTFKDFLKNNCENNSINASSFNNFLKENSGGGLSQSCKDSMKCGFCGKHFTHKGSLNIHLRIHTGEKPYKCDECGKSFSQKGVLIGHKRKHTGVKPFKCEQCEKTFTEKGTLTKHLRIHTGEKPFKCDECGKSFNQKSSYIKHIRIHTGDKPYKCEECKRCFSQRSTLVGHMRLHAGIKPYQCDICKNRYTFKNGVISHITRMHPSKKTFK